MTDLHREGAGGVTYRAVVFDLDGVLWDGEPLYHEAFNVVLRPLGVTVTPEDYVNIIGSSVEAAWDWVLKRYGITDSPQEFYRKYDEAVLVMLEEPVEPLEGVKDLLAELKARNVPVGLASASLRHWVDATLRGIGLEGQFDTTVSASEVKHSKPAPDLYLKAAENLGIDPKRCIAVEDTGSGLRAAKAAGMYGVQVRAASTALEPQEEADLVIDVYTDFPLHLLG